MGPLSAFRIIEFEGLGATPFAAMLLADLGADMVRIARPAGRPNDVLGDAGAAILHRGRPFIPADLKQAEVRDGVLDLIADADALIEGFRPGVMERMGLGPNDCLARNPRLVYGRMTGWGQDGPLARRAGHDINYIALTGALHAIGERDRPPVPPLNLVGDFGGGAMLLTVGVLAGLLEAQRSHRGQVVDAAMIDGASLLMSMTYALLGQGHWQDRPAANLLDGGAPYYACYECADGRHVAVGALEPKFFAALLDGLGLSHLALDQHDQAGWPAMRDLFAAAFRTQPRDVWASRFKEVDACVAPVLSLAEAPRHSHNATRETFRARDGFFEPAAAPRFGRTPAEAGTAPETTSIADTLARWRPSIPRSCSAP